MKRLLASIVLVILAALTLGFTVLNSAPVRVDLYLVDIAVPTAVVVLVAIVVGALAGLFAAAGFVLRHRREAWQERRRAEIAEQEIRNLRQIPIHDRH